MIESENSIMNMGHPDLSLDITTLTQQYQAGTLTPVNLVETLYQRLAAHAENPIWITLLPQEVVLEAARALQNQGREGLPLFGIPFAVKDNIDVAGLPTTAACPAFSYVPERHASVVEQLLNAGAILIGKTNLDQFATGLVGTRSPYGVCQNAFNSNYISGGSSSGSAVAVAAGLVSFALGTDTAGSGRVPAAFQNIVGLKPTRGVISTTGVVPACRSLDCVSVFALTSDDAQQILTVAQGFDPNESYARRPPKPSLLSSLAGVVPFRVGILAATDLTFFGDRDYQQLFHQSITRLEAIGGISVEIDFAPFRDAAQLLYSGPWIVERYCALQDFFTHHAEEILPVTREIISKALTYSAIDVFQGFYQLEALKQRAAQVWENIDVLVLPTAGTVYTIEDVHTNPIELNTNLGYYTNFVNLLDLSAIALPAGFRPDELPFGITLIAPAFRDRYLCTLGTLYQRALGGNLGATGLPYAPIPAQ